MADTVKITKLDKDGNPVGEPVVAQGFVKKIEAPKVVDDKNRVIWPTWNPSDWGRYDFFREEWQGLGSEFDRLPMASLKKNDKRQTGRTSDMLWQAACAKDEGLPILIVVHQMRMAEHCLRSLKGEWWGLTKDDFTSIEHAARGLRNRFRYTPQIYVDHFVEELVYETRIISEAYREFMETVHLMRRYDQDRQVIDMAGFLRRP